MNILLTGGAGYIGSHVAHLLVDEGHQVSVVDNLYSGFRRVLPPGATFYQADVTDSAQLEKIFAAQNFDVVMHFAAYTQVGESVLDPVKYYFNNTVGTVRLLAAMQKYQVKNLVFSSTAAVYGGSYTQPVLETDSPLPESPYGQSKLFSERVIQDLSQAWPDFRYMNLRYFNVAGAHPAKNIGQATHGATHLIKVAVEVAAGKRDRLEIYGTDYATPDGTCIRDYIHVCDLAQAHLLAMQAICDREPSTVMNVGYSHGYSVREVINAVQEVTGVSLKVKNGPRRPGDVVSVIADTKKIRERLHFKPQYDDLKVICQTAYQFENKLKADPWV